MHTAYSIACCSLLALAIGCSGLKDAEDRRPGEDAGRDHDASIAPRPDAGHMTRAGADAGGRSGAGGSEADAGGQGDSGNRGGDGGRSSDAGDADSATDDPSDAGDAGPDAGPEPVDECAMSLDDCDDDPDACVDTADGYDCVCPEGYSGLGHGDIGCRDIDECTLDQDDCGPGTCNNTRASYSCDCPDGYDGDDTTQCTEIDECLAGAVTACGAGATACDNTDGSWSCTCDSGYDGTGGTACTSHVDPGPPPCISDGDDVLLIGDSYVNYINNLAPRIETLARVDGALAAGDGYRDLAVAGSSVRTGEIGSQWDTAKASAVPKYVVMDGGLEDFAIDNMQCAGVGADQDTACRALAAEIAGVMSGMWGDMRDRGVTEVLFFFYPHLPDDDGKDILDYTSDLLEAACAAQQSATFRCQFLDPRPIFEGQSFFSIDDIHPNAAGADALAQALWNEMKLQCMAQSSGCCSM